MFGIMSNEDDFGSEEDLDEDLEDLEDGEDQEWEEELAEDLIF
ncbi:MAG: hypothetical protein ACE5KU_04380 [Nitrososphaerales archaeon]